MLCAAAFARCSGARCASCVWAVPSMGLYPQREVWPRTYSQRSQLGDGVHGTCNASQSGRRLVFWRDRMINSPNPIECIAPMRLVPGTRRGTEPHELRHRTCLPRICAVGKDLAQPTTPLAFTGVALAWPAPRARQVLAADLQTHEWTLSNRRTGPLSAISGSPFATIGEH